MERAMGIEPTSEAWEARNKKLETPDLAALSRSGPEPKDEPRNTRLYRNWRRRRPRGTRLTTGEGAVSEAGPGCWINSGAYEEKAESSSLTKPKAVQDLVSLAK